MGTVVSMGINRQRFSLNRNSVKLQSCNLRKGAGGMKNKENGKTEQQNVMQAWKEEGKQFLVEEDAVSVVEIVLIIVVLISLVIIFKTQLTSLVTNILNKITSQSNSI